MENAQDTQTFEPINEVLLPPFLSEYCCDAMYNSKCHCWKAGTGSSTHTGVYFSEPFTFGTHTINLIILHRLTESCFLPPALTLSLSFDFQLKEQLHSGTEMLIFSEVWLRVVVCGESCEAFCWKVTNYLCAISLKLCVTPLKCSSQWLRQVFFRHFAVCFYFAVITINGRSNIVILHACGLSGHSPFLSPMQRLLSVMLTHAQTQCFETLHVTQIQVMCGFFILIYTTQMHLIKFLSFIILIPNKTILVYKKITPIIIQD